MALVEIILEVLPTDFSLLLQPMSGLSRTYRAYDLIRVVTIEHTLNFLHLNLKLWQLEAILDLNH